mmetsp:Transcript_5039/g.13455  ORF Transcript_5039/g.13455 Transcript_5039/m.13455 type:complete len:525 (+) Transcript_5039:264-1838(+)
MRTSASRFCAASMPSQAVHEEAVPPQLSTKKVLAERPLRAIRAPETQQMTLLVIAQIDGREVAVVQRNAAADVGQPGGAPDAPEVDVRVVRPATGCVPVVPRVAPLAARPQLRGQGGAAAGAAAAAPVVVAVELAGRVPRELARAAGVEGALPRPGDHQVEAVLPDNIVPDVRNLHHHALACQLRVGAAPGPAAAAAVLLVREAELVALPAVVVPAQAVQAAHGGGGEAHAQPAADRERLLVGASPRAAAHAGRRLRRAGGRVVCLARAHGRGRPPLPWPSAAGLAAVPVTSRPRARHPLRREGRDLRGSQCWRHRGCTRRRRRRRGRRSQRRSSCWCRRRRPCRHGRRSERRPSCWCRRRCPCRRNDGSRRGRVRGRAHWRPDFAPCCLAGAARLAPVRRRAAPGAAALPLGAGPADVAPAGRPEAAERGLLRRRGCGRQGRGPRRRRRRGGGRRSRRRRGCRTRRWRHRGRGCERRGGRQRRRGRGRRSRGCHWRNGRAGFGAFAEAAAPEVLLELLEGGLR